MCSSDLAPDRVIHPRIDMAEQKMRRARFLLRSRTRRENMEIAIHLHRVGVDDGAADARAFLKLMDTVKSGKDMPTAKDIAACHCEGYYLVVFKDGQIWEVATGPATEPGICRFTPSCSAVPAGFLRSAVAIDTGTAMSVPLRLSAFWSTGER